MSDVCFINVVLWCNSYSLYCVMQFLVLNSYRYIWCVVHSILFSWKCPKILKASSKIHYIVCACVAPRRRDLWRQDVLSRRHILQRRPQGLFLQKVIKKSQMWNYFAKRAKLQKIRPAAPQPGDRSPGTCLQFFVVFFCRLAPAARRAAGRPGYISVNFQLENIFL